MPNTFKNAFNKNVGTTPVTTYTCPSATQTTLIGLSVANTSTSPITCDAYITSSSTDFFLIKNGVVPVGGTLVIVGGEQKVVLEPTDALKIVTSAASSADVVVSFLEIT